MSTASDTPTRTHHGRDRHPHLPAYGPVDAVVGYAVFYVFVERATPTTVDVFTTAVPGIAAETVRLALAALLWFVLAVTVLEQLQRQLAALGVGTRTAVARADREAGTPGETRLLAYLGGLAAGGAVAVWTFETAVQAGIALIRIVGTLDSSAFVTVEFVVMVVFFVGFAVATHSLDRLVIGTVRRLIER